MSFVARLALLLLLAGVADAAQRDTSGSEAPYDAAQDSVRIAALRRDPRTLPRAADGRWKDFDRNKVDERDLPQGMRVIQAALVDRDLPLALSELQKLLETEPDYPPALHQMGVLYFRLQRYGDAIELLERFVHHMPNKVGETRVLGHCYYSLGNYAKAKEHYLRVGAAAPRDSEALRGLGLSEMRLGNGERALEILRKVVEIDPKQADALTWIAQILFDEDHAQEALKEAERARDLDPFQARPWFLLGQILVDLGREPQALEAQARYLELSEASQQVRSLESRLLYDSHQLPLLAQLVEVHRTIGNLPKTREALARLLRERPEDVPLRIHALDVLQGMGDADGAQLAARALEKIGADDASAWKRLESYYARVKDRVRQVQAGERYQRLKTD